MFLVRRVRSRGVPHQLLVVKKMMIKGRMLLRCAALRLTKNSMMIIAAGHDHDDDGDDGDDDEDSMRPCVSRSRRFKQG